MGASASIGAFPGHASCPLEHIRKSDADVRVAVDHMDPREKGLFHKILYTVFMNESPDGEDVVFQSAFETDSLVGKFSEKHRHQGDPETARAGSRAHQRDGVHRLEAYRVAHILGGYRLHPGIERYRLTVGHPQTLYRPRASPGDASDSQGCGNPLEVDPSAADRQRRQFGLPRSMEPSGHRDPAVPPSHEGGRMSCGR
ncbi:MAG: hypothetical protein H6Q81_310 [Deltaproteobacteria bacterium]|nr:hypothetical protein [Deltaproteobacteria bacterium]